MVCRDRWVKEVISCSGIFRSGIMELVQIFFDLAGFLQGGESSEKVVLSKVGHENSDIRQKLVKKPIENSFIFIIEDTYWIINSLFMFVVFFFI